MKETATIYSYVKSDINELKTLLEKINASTTSLDAINEQKEPSEIVDSLKKLINVINPLIAEEKAKNEVIKAIYNLIDKVNNLTNKQNGNFNQIIPNEVLKLFFDFITNWKDRESARRTCKHWNSIFQTHNVSEEDKRFLEFISNDPSQTKIIKKQIALCDDAWQKTENGRVFYNKLFPHKESKTGLSTEEYNISNRLQLDVRIIQYDKGYFGFIKNANLVVLFVDESSMAITIPSKITQIKTIAPNAKILLGFSKHIQNEKAEEIKNQVNQCEIEYFEFSKDNPHELKRKIVKTVYKTEIEEYKHVGSIGTGYNLK